MLYYSLFLCFPLPLPPVVPGVWGLLLLRAFVPSPPPETSQLMPPGLFRCVLATPCEHIAASTSPLSPLFTSSEHFSLCWQNLGIFAHLSFLVIEIKGKLHKYSDFFFSAPCPPTASSVQNSTYLLVFAKIKYFKD